MTSGVDDTRWGQLIGILLGAPLVAVGVWGAYRNLPAEQLRSAALWMAGGVVLHDFVWLPIALAVGGVLGTRVARPWRRPVAFLLGAGVTISAMALPFVLGYGRRADTPSLLPRNYGAGLAVYLGLLAIGSLCWALATARSRPEQGGEEAQQGDQADR